MVLDLQMPHPDVVATPDALQIKMSEQSKLLLNHLRLVIFTSDIKNTNLSLWKYPILE